MTETVDRIWRNGRLATLATSGTQGGAPYGAIEAATVASRDGRIVWLGPAAEVPAMAAAEIIDLDGRWVTPGLVDCHTHLVYAGNRAAEFEQRLQGDSYEDISRAGGGILSTVREIRAASEAELERQSLPRLDRLLAEGVTTIEIKSGYGLDADNECKMLRVARRLGEARPVRVVTSFLGAHALPPEADGDMDAYIDNVCDVQLPAAAGEGLADAVDGFCDTIGFTLDQTRRVFEAAKRHGLPVKLHAEQLSNAGGTLLAAEYGALSADHLEYADEEAVSAMARTGTVAVMLPGAFYFLRDTNVPPIDLFRQHGVAMAVATDSNPGSSPMTSLLLAMNMASTLFLMTPEEALAGATRNAARAVGLGDEIGTLEVGKRCDLAIWDIEHPAELAYGIAVNPLHQRVFGGET